MRSEWPSVTLVIAAYNEEDVIEEKIKNSLKLDYPADKFDIIVFSDESSDRTDEIVRTYESDGIELQRIEGRVGKTECQNQVTARIDSDIVVYSDANSMYEPNAIKNLIRGFEPGVGCVVGELQYHDEGGVEGESFYWRYEQIIKRLESKVNSLVTGNGSIYAVRRSSYVTLSRDAISDFAEPLAVISNGESVKYASGAVAWEKTGDSIESERSRRVRIVTRCWNTVFDYLELMNPVRFPLFSFQLISHKILRWLSPVLLLFVFLSNLALVLLSSSVLFPLLLLLQLVFYLFALIGMFGESAEIEMPVLFHVPYYFLVSNYGMLLGLSNFLFGENIITWETVERSAD
ncbi:glycosyltransferase family 2 protein [Haladaptatus sp. W1]|uniref:glycosyltransferase family 2 protein n=1 Tax=Haladaptatus sp. W1 TaxID=1897478 RepID=UPI00211165BD|nr:glycosyltransferase family 2 protein [Haladaptatus sp. W1]